MTATPARPLSEKFAAAARRWHELAERARREGSKSSLCGEDGIPSHVLCTVREDIWRGAAEDATEYEREAGASAATALLPGGVLWPVKKNLEAIVVRCTEGDPRTDWLPIIARLANEALAALAAPQEPRPVPDGNTMYLLKGIREWIDAGHGRPTANVLADLDSLIDWTQRYGDLRAAAGQHPAPDDPEMPI
jgi:hypothetical protein